MKKSRLKRALIAAVLCLCLIFPVACGGANDGGGDWWTTTGELTKDANGKPKRMSIPKFIINPEEITLADALTLSSLPKNLGTHSKTGKEIFLYLGRFGPYLSCDNHTFKLEKDISFLHLSLSDAEKIIG